MVLCGEVVHNLICITTGVDQRKFYTEKKSGDAIEAFVKANAVSDEVAQEQVYNKHREALQKEIR